MAAPFKRFFKRGSAVDKEGAESESGDVDGDALPHLEALRLDSPDGSSTPANTATETQTHYGLFQRLPLELRRLILAYAFGNRTIHIDAGLVHPPTPKSDAADGTETRPGCMHCGLKLEMIEGTEPPKQLLWYSCVCHRNEDHASGDKKWLEPCEDECIPGVTVGVTRVKLALPGPHRCSTAVGHTTLRFDKYRVGVMGWLLACRQAYADGIDILYTTNTFHITSSHLLSNLPTVLPPHHLAKITSLELLWCFRDPSLFDDKTMRSLWFRGTDTLDSEYNNGSPPSEQENRLHHLCETIPQVFPNVRRLYVSLQAHIAPQYHIKADTLNVLADVERIILSPVEDMFRRLGPGKGKEFRLAIQRGGWSAFEDRERERKKAEGEDAGAYKWDLWRPLGEDIVDGDGEGEGYWLCQGWDDYAFFGASYWLYDFWSGSMYAAPESQ